VGPSDPGQVAQQERTERRPGIRMLDREVVDHAGEAARVVHGGRRRESSDHEAGHVVRFAGHEEDVIRVLDEALQVRRVPRDRVSGLTPELRLVSLVVAAAIRGQGGHFVDVVVSRRSGGLSVHAFILSG
jgi:hypothetical protein